jgi:hypothetical protein
MMRDKEGTPSGSYAMYAIVGAMLAELAADGVIQIGGEDPLSPPPSRLPPR